MSNSLADQLTWCVSTQDYLNSLVDELKYAADAYRTDVETLADLRYIAEGMPVIRAMSEEFEREVYGLIQYIQKDHQTYIQTQIDTLTSVNLS